MIRSRKHIIILQFSYQQVCLFSEIIYNIKGHHQDFIILLKRLFILFKVLLIGMTIIVG